MQTIRIWKTTLLKLRIISAIIEKTMVQVLDDLVDVEYQRLKDRLPLEKEND